MTLCIAAIASGGSAIVAASDMRFDLGYTSGDGSPKMGRLNKFWAAMFAGSDIANAPAVLANISEALKGREDANRADVEKLFIDECRADFRRRVESLVLSPFGITLDQFTKSGQKCFSPDAYARIFNDISGLTVPYEFLVFGFDADRNANLFGVGKGGKVDDFRAFGFWAIGSGDMAAVHHMFFHEYTIAIRKRIAAYHVCAAKYFAERASLGERTYVRCLMSDGLLLEINESDIRELWKHEGRPRMPLGIWDRLPSFTDAEGKPSDDHIARPGAGSVTVAGAWISSSVTLHSPSAGFTSGPDTPMALKPSATKEED